MKTRDDKPVDYCPNCGTIHAIGVPCGTCPQHYVPYKWEAKGNGGGKWYCPKCRQNRNRRLRNAALRELCGTPAKAAREDVGM